MNIASVRFTWGASAPRFCPSSRPPYVCHPERGSSFAPQARRTTAVEGSLRPSRKPRAQQGISIPPSSRRHRALLPQQLLQHPNPLIHMLLLQQERRQKPHHSILRRIKQNSLSQSRIHNRPRRNLQINPLDKSAPAYFLSRRALLGNRPQLLL